MQTPLSKLKTLFKFRFTIKKNHRILEFKQPFLKPYIKCNTDLQREAEKEGNKVKKSKCLIKK